MKGKNVMSLSVLVIIVVTCLFLGLFFYFKLKSTQSVSGSYVYISIPFSSSINLETKEIADSFSKQWGYEISFSKSNNGYVISRDKNQLTLELHNERLPKNLVDLLTAPFYGLSEDELQKLRFHKAFISIQGLGQQGNSKEQVLLAAHVMLTLFKEKGAIGFANFAAQSYYPISRFESYLDKAVLQPEELYFLFVSVQQVDGQDSYWYHTHGLEQFGVPNIEINFLDKGDADYYQSVIENTSVYLIAKGDIIKSGNTLELMGDGVVFKATLKRDQEFPTGVLTLTRQ
jgi:hypothetical protein